MARRSRGRDEVHEFLGSVHVLASALNEVVEKRLLREVSGGRLTLPQLRLLKMLDLAGGRTITDVALFLGVSKAAASMAVDRLVRRRLLRRAEGEPDRRVIRVTPTATGERLLERYEARRAREMARLFRGIPASVLSRTAGVLDRLSAGLVDHDAGEEVCLRCGIHFRERCLVRQLAKRNCFYLRDRGPDGEARVRANGSARASRGA